MSIEAQQLAYHVHHEDTLRFLLQHIPSPFIRAELRRAQLYARAYANNIIAGIELPHSVEEL